jgi:hypothetical protein
VAKSTTRTPKKIRDLFEASGLREALAAAFAMPEVVDLYDKALTCALLGSLLENDLGQQAFDIANGLLCEAARTACSLPEVSELWGETAVRAHLKLRLLQVLAPDFAEEEVETWGLNMKPRRLWRGQQSHIGAWKDGRPLWDLHAADELQIEPYRRWLRGVVEGKPVNLGGRRQGSGTWADQEDFLNTATTIVTELRRAGMRLTPPNFAKALATRGQPASLKQLGRWLSDFNLTWDEVLAL